MKHNHAFPFVVRNKQKEHLNPPTTRKGQRKLRTILDATKKISTKTYTVTYSKKKKNINSKLFMIRKNACHETPLIGKENNY